MNVGSSLKRARRVFALIAVLVLALSSAALAFTMTDGADPTPPPTISSDRGDYAPGDTVVLTGENWRPSERVRIQVRAEEGYDWSRDVEVTAAADGTIRDEFRLPDYYVPRYYVTATGETSGTATTTFTDGNIRVRAGGPAGTTFTLRYTRYTTTNCTGTPSGSTTTVNNVNSTTGTTINSVNNGQSVLLEAAARSDQGGEFVNFTSSNPFTVTAQGPRFICVQGFAGNGTRDYTANYAAPANLSITKNGPATVVTGQNFSYTLAVNNAQGAGPANDVTVTDTLPVGVTLNGSLPAGCTSSGTNPITVTCDLGAVAPGQTVSRTINVTAPGTPGTLENRARVTSSTDPTPNDSNLEQTTVVAEANLAIDKADSKDPVPVNGNFSYTLSVSNAQGAGTATGVVVRDTLPEGVALNGSLPADCSSTTGTDGRNTVTCNLGTVNPGQTVNRTINVTAGGPPRTLSNTATVSSPRDRTDASDTEQTTVVPAADLSLTKTDSPDPATVGQNLTYILTVTNNGPNPAINVVIRDTLPANATFVSASDGCTESEGIVTCNVGDLANGASATREIVVRLTASGTLNNSATVTSDTADPNTANNSATATTTVNAADLSITKEGPATVGTGQPFSYKFTVNNAVGAATATNVKVEDTLPEGVTLNGALPGNCSSTGTGAAGNPVKVTCTLPNIPGGGSQSVSINVRAPNTPGPITNQRATVTSPNDPETSSSNQVTTQVIAANLTITKQDTPDPVNVGQDLQYTVRVTNAAGGGDAADVRVTDQLPANTTFLSATPSQGTCPTKPVPGDPSGPVGCDLGTVAAGGTATVTIVVRPTPAAAGTELSNEASVQSPSDPGTSPTPKRATATTQVNAEADLSISKSGPATATNGQPFNYTVTVTNNGPNAAQNVVVTDDLPTGVTYNDAQSTPSCEEISGTADPNDIRCTLASLAAGDTRTFVINVTPTETANLSNTASVASDTRDPDTSNNTSSPVTETTVNPAADLSIQKTDEPDPVTYGNELTYTLTVANGGPNPASNVTVTDNLPANATFVSATSSQGTCPTKPAPGSPGGTVSCDLGTVAAGDTATVTIVVKPTAGAVGAQITNTASVTSPTFDPDTNDRSAQATTDVNAANLEISKDDGTQTGRVPAGQNFTYTLRITNNGPADARDVVVTDRLPDVVTFVDAPQCSYDSSTRVVTCLLGNIASGDPPVVREIEVTAPAEEATFTNTATVRSPNDPSGGRDAERTTTAEASSDLSIEKVSDPATVTGEDTFVYRLTVRNAGPSTAQGVAVTDDLPAGVEFVSVSSSRDTPDQRACTEPAQPDGTITCNLGSLAPGGDPITVEIRVKAKTPTPPNEPLSNTATVSTQTSDPDPDNDSDSATTTVVARADLSIIKEAPTTVVDEDDFTYRLSVTNNGPSSAEGVVVTDRLPDGVQFVSSDGCGPPNTEGVMTCNLGTLNSGATVEAGIVVKAKQLGPQRNVAAVSSETPDPDEANNRSSEVTTVVLALADLAISKGAPARTIDENSFAYTLRVTNNGPSDADDAVIRDRIPAGVKFVSASGGCAYVASNRTVTCDAGTLASGATAERRITVRAKTSGEKVNQVTVDSGTEDPNTANNSDTATTVIRPQPVPTADLSLRKNANPEPVTVGEKLTYTLTVKNRGPDTATGVVVKDLLPREVTFVSTSEGCKYSKDTVTCEVNRLADGTSVTRKIVVRVKKAGELRNTATVESEAKDPSPTNDADTEYTMAKSAPEPILPAGCEETSGSGKVIKGTGGNDTLRGTPGDDTIFGFGGDDAIYGFGGNDTVVAGAGDDAIAAGSGDDVVCTGSGTNAVHANGGSDRVFGGSSNDAIYGGDGGDFIDGGDGGSKALSGGGGSDTIRGGGGRDAVDGGPGRDKVYGEGRSDTLDVSDGARDDLVDGGDGGDTCSFDRGDQVKSCP